MYIYIVWSEPHLLVSFSAFRWQETFFFGFKCDEDFRATGERFELNWKKNVTEKNIIIWFIWIR